MKKIFALLLCAFTVAFVSCKNDRTDDVVVQFDTPVVTDVSGTAATVSCHVVGIKSVGSIPVTFAYGNENEDVNEYVLASKPTVSGTSFTSRLTGLKPGTNYKVVALLQIGVQRTVSVVTSFTTKDIQPDETVLEITSLTTIPADAEAGVYTINYTVINGQADVKATAAVNKDASGNEITWVNSFDNATIGEISFDVDANTGAERRAVITVSYPDAESCTVTVVQRAATVTPPPSDETKEIVLDASTSGWPSGYSKGTSKIGQYYYQLTDVARFAANDNEIQFKRTSGVFANGEDMGAIRRIEINFSGSHSTMTLALGEQVQPAAAMAPSFYRGVGTTVTNVDVPGTVSGDTQTFDCTGYDFHYFTLTNGDGVSYINSIKIVCGGQGGPTPTPSEPKFTTPSYGDLTKNSATITGSYSYTGDKTVTDAYFMYAAPSGSEQRVNVASIQPGNKSAALSGLTPSTRYTFRLCVVVDGKTYSSQTGAFTTYDEQGVTPPADTRYAGWAELPTEDAQKINTEYFYAYHLCPDFSIGGRKARNFTTCYSKDKRCPVWVAAPLHDCYAGGVNRTNAYRTDPDINCTQAGKWNGYTRGHMLGSNERRVTTNVNRDVFYYSNIAPQLGGTIYFNTGGGQWNTAEDWVDKQWRGLADTLYQVVGTNWVGSPKVVDGTKIPTHFYIVLLKAKKSAGKKWVVNCSANELQTIAIYIEHKAYTKSEVVKPGDFQARGIFMSVADVEQKTGHKFFANVPNAPKSSYSTSDWTF